jgi:hypothetical protein
MRVCTASFGKRLKKDKRHKIFVSCEGYYERELKEEWRREKVKGGRIEAIATGFQVPVEKR